MKITALNCNNEWQLGFEIKLSDFYKSNKKTLDSHPSAAWAMHAKQQKMGVAIVGAIAVNKCHIHSLKLM